MGFTLISYMKQMRLTELKPLAQGHKTHDPLLLRILPWPPRQAGEEPKSWQQSWRPPTIWPPWSPWLYSEPFSLSPTSPGPHWLPCSPRKYSHFWTFALAVTTACNTPFPQYLLCALLHFLESLLKYHLLSSLTTLSIPPTTLALFILLPCFLSLHPICYFYWCFVCVCK